MRTILGLERLEEYGKLFQGKRIGLITNFTGILPDWSQSTVDRLIGAGYEVCRLFTPEHGLYGAAAGEAVEDGRHPRYGIQVVSLYGSKRRPKQEDLEGLDLLVYDIQDLGLRYYTYLYTMCYTLEAAGEAGIPYVILDRPDPLGGMVGGARLEPDIHSFVGDYELPLRYGLTIGEAARYFLKYTRKKAELAVIPMENYQRSTVFPDTGLVWNVPSPAIPTFESALCYYGGCLFEAVNISEGRGTAKPFQMYGAPFLDMDVMYEDLVQLLQEDGVEWQGKFLFRRRTFVPESSKYKGELCCGLEFLPLCSSCNFLPVALALMKAISRRYPDKLELRAIPGNEGGHHLAILSGNIWAEDYIAGKMTMEQMMEGWKEQREKYEEFVGDVRIYQ